MRQKVVKLACPFYSCWAASNDDKVKKFFLLFFGDEGLCCTFKAHQQLFSDFESVGNLLEEMSVFSNSRNVEGLIDPTDCNHEFVVRYDEFLSRNEICCRSGVFVKDT